MNGGLRAPVQESVPLPVWTGPGSCPRPPEMDSPAARRGDRAARRQRLAIIAEISAIIANGNHADGKAAIRQRQWVLERYQGLEREDPSPPECRPRIPTSPAELIARTRARRDRTC